MLELISIGAGALVGFIASGLVGYLFWWRQKQVEGAVRLHDEYHAAGMFESRGRAWEFLKKYPDVAMSDMHSKPELSHVSVVAHFFERVCVLGEYRLVDKALCRRLIGAEYDYWHGEHFMRLQAREVDGSAWQELFRTLHRATHWLSPRWVERRQQNKTG